MRYIAASFKLLLFAFHVLWIVPLQSLILFLTRGPASYILPRLWHSAVRRTLGIKVNVAGVPCQMHQTIFMSNHMSYLDIPVLGSLIKGSFVAKSEVEGWALFGYLSTLQQTAFIKRTKTAIDAAKNNLEEMMKSGKSLIIFPEGTSTDGQSVRAFKSSLFMLALNNDNPDLMVQPVTIHVLRSDKRGITDQESRDLYAWHVDMDMDLGAHLWRFAKLRGAEVNVIFHKPLRAADYSDRKILCKACHDAVSGGLLSGAVA